MLEYEYPASCLQRIPARNLLEYGYHSSCQRIPARNELEYEYPASCIQHIYLPAASTEYEYPYSCLQRVHSTSTPPVSSTNTCPQRVRVRVALQLLTNACPHELEYEYPSSCIQRVPARNEYRVRVPSSCLEGIRKERCVDVKTRVFHMHIHTNAHFTCLLNTGECLLTERHLVSPSYHPRVYSSSRSLRGQWPSVPTHRKLLLTGSGGHCGQETASGKAAQSLTWNELQETPHECPGIPFFPPAHRCLS